MQASIITVGDEILIGQVIDSNSAWLGQQLSEIGISVKKIWSVADESAQIILGMKQALEETDILFMTGGLGPTKDDITKKAIADFLGRDMYFDNGTQKNNSRGSTKNVAGAWTRWTFYQENSG